MAQIVPTPAKPANEAQKPKPDVQKPPVFTDYASI